MSDTLDRLKAALADRYAIEREVGHGGMATVYLAQDLKHHRQVAVKVLRPDLAASLGPERFLREIEVAAQLTHPHILPLHDSGEAEGFLYFVMPFIEGESLRERLLKEGELPVTEAVRIIREVVDALAHAHAHGVVHRDIKPDNIMLSGRHAMVTDFGVAKAVSEATGRQTLTTAGVALGTPAYMSPEQAAADPHVDHRADIYAVGALAYELLTGRPPFIGTSPQQVLSAHVTEEPEPVTSRRTTIPPSLDHLVMKCLAKRPADRWQTAEEMLPHLEGLEATPSGGLTPTGTMPVPAVQPRSGGRVAVVAGATVVMAVLGFLGWSSFRSASPAITVSNIRQVTRAPEAEFQPAISPSGREVAYTTRFFGTRQAHIAVRDLGGGRAIPLTADRPGHQGRPRWSADGQKVVFRERGAGTSNGLYAIPRFGGPSTAVDAEVIGDIRHDSMAYISGDSLLIQPLGGGEPRLVATVPPGSHSVAWSPDGTRIAAVEGNGQWVDGVNIAPSHIWTVELATGRPVRVTENLSLNVSPQWLPDGRGLLFVSNRNGPRDVYLVWLDGSGARRSDPVRVTTGLNPHSISIADDGSKLVYSQLVFRTNIWELPIPETGSVSLSMAKQVTVGNQTIENHGLSSDGQWLAYDSNRDGNQEIYLMPLAGGEPRQLTTDPGDDFHPDFSPDGKELVFYSMRHGTRDLFIISADGGNEVRLTDSPGQELHPAFSPDGLSIAYQGSDETGTTFITVISREAIGEAWSAPRRLTQGTNARWSRDGEWIVFERGDSIVASTLDGQERVVVDGPAMGFVAFFGPEWSWDGQEVYFLGTDREETEGLWAVPARGGSPRLVIRFDDPARAASAWYITAGAGKVYLSLIENESDIWVMDLEY